MSEEALERESISQLVLGTPPLVESYLSLDDQLQPNGFDLSLREVGRLASAVTWDENQTSASYRRRSR